MRGLQEVGTLPRFSDESVDFKRNLNVSRSVWKSRYKSYEETYREKKWGIFYVTRVRLNWKVEVSQAFTFLQLPAS